MKFKKKDIDKLINILESKKEELKDFNEEDLFEIRDNETVHIIDIPDLWCIRPTTKEEAKVIFDFHNTISNGRYGFKYDMVDHWKYFTHYDKNVMISYDQKLNKKYKILTFEEFKTIINTKKWQ